MNFYDKLYDVLWDIGYYIERAKVNTQSFVRGIATKVAFKAARIARIPTNAEEIRLYAGYGTWMNQDNDVYDMFGNPIGKIVFFDQIEEP